jgi:predicted TIM-barrel fold metal-dependent hydrolase
MQRTNHFDEKIIDFGAHFHPEDPPTKPDIHQYIQNQQGGDNLHSDFGDLAARYRKTGIDCVTLSREDVIGSGNLERVQKENDAMRSLADERGCVYTLAAIPTEAGAKEAAEELERCIKAGHNGGVVETKSGDTELHHSKLEPTLAAADRLGAPLMVHPKIDNSLHSDVLSDEWRLNAVFGREFALCESIFKTVHSGLLDKHPDLNLVFHHLGGNISAMFGRIQGDHMGDRWPTTDRLKSYESFRDQLTDRVYLDTAGFYGDPSAFQAASQVFPPSNMLFATDFPYETRTPEDFKNIISTIKQIYSKKESKNILGGNARSIMVNV